MYTRWVIMAMSCFVLVVNVLSSWWTMLIYQTLISLYGTSAADGLVLATRADHHVSAGVVVHDWRTRLQYDDFLQPGGTTRTYHPYRQNGHRRCNVLLYLWGGRFSFNFCWFCRFLGHTVQVAGQKGIPKIRMVAAKDILEQERPLSLPSFRTKSNILGWALVQLQHLKARRASGMLPNSSWLRTAAWSPSVEGNTYIYQMQAKFLHSNY